MESDFQKDFFLPAYYRKNSDQAWQLKPMIPASERLRQEGRVLGEVSHECCSLRQGFPFGLALLVQTEWLTSPGNLRLHLCSVGFTDTGRHVRSLSFHGKDFTD